MDDLGSDDRPSQCATSREGFKKSSFSTATCTCVEVCLDLENDRVLIRDSKYRGDLRAEPMIVVPLQSWTDFLTDFHATASSATDSILQVQRGFDGGAILEHGGISLRYSADEWTAFADGVKAGEFAPDRFHDSMSRVERAPELIDAT